jgi:3-phenylpropionate/trans-cinnamate dioxygenase ferredoxin component
MMFNYVEKSAETCEFYEITPADALQPGERLFVDIADRPIVVFNIAGEFFAIGDVCSHDNGPLGDGDIEDHTVTCPRHGGQFDVRTGKATMLPAVQDIPAYPVRIVDGTVHVGVPRE